PCLPPPVWTTAASLTAPPHTTCGLVSTIVRAVLENTTDRANLSSVIGIAGQRSARKPRADGERSRQTILAAAARLATTDGLDGLSIGRLAEHIGMSKSGLYAHFGSKEDLQLATIETAAEIFRIEVTEPAEEAATPRERIAALCEQFLAHVERRT